MKFCPLKFVHERFTTKRNSLSWGHHKGEPSTIIIRMLFKLPPQPEGNVSATAIASKAPVKPAAQVTKRYSQSLQELPSGCLLLLSLCEIASILDLGIRRASRFLWDAYLSKWGFMGRSRFLDKRFVLSQPAHLHQRYHSHVHEASYERGCL